MYLLSTAATNMSTGHIYIKRRDEDGFSNNLWVLFPIINIKMQLFFLFLFLLVQGNNRISVTSSLLSKHRC